MYSAVNKKRKFNSYIRRKAISAMVLTVALVSLFGVTVAWLPRTQTSTSTMVLGLRESGKVMPITYQVTTSYFGLDDEWHEINTNYQMDSTKEYEENMLLVAGEETQFKTVIKNLLQEEQVASVYLHGLEIDKTYIENGGAISPRITIGSHSPETFTCPTSAYVYNSAKGCYEVDNMTLALLQTIPAGGEITVEWYIAINSQIAGGDFPALCDSSGPILGPGSTAENKLYWAVVDNDGINKPRACLSNDEGDIIYDPDVVYFADYYKNLHKDEADYDPYVGVTMDYVRFGDSLQYVNIDGMYIAVD